jgi:hypothetical protein
MAVFDEVMTRVGERVVAELVRGVV